MRARAAANGCVRIEDVDAPRSARPARSDAILRDARRATASRGTARSCASRSARRATTPRSQRLRERGRVYRVRVHAPRARACAASAQAASASIPGTCRARHRRRRAPRAARALRVRVDDTPIAFTDRLQGPQQQDARARRRRLRRAPRRRPVRLPARRRRRRRRAGRSPTSCAAPTCSRRRRARSSCSGCSACRRRATCTCRSRSTRAGEKLSKQTRARALPDDAAAGAARRVAISRPAAPDRCRASPASSGAGRSRLDAGATAAGGDAAGAHALIACSQRTLAQSRIVPVRLRDSPRSRANPPCRMTTLVVVRKGDDIAIAADSLDDVRRHRASPREHDRTYDKIVRYRGTYIGLCGSAAHQLVFESLLAEHGDLDFSHKVGDLRDVPQAASDPEGAALPEPEGGGRRSVRVDADHGADRQRATASSACSRCARCSSTRSSGPPARAASSRWARCRRSTRSSRRAEAVARAGIEAGATFDKNSALPMTLLHAAAPSGVSREPQSGLERTARSASAAHPRRRAEPGAAVDADPCLLAAPPRMGRRTCARWRRRAAGRLAGGDTPRADASTPRDRRHVYQGIGRLDRAIAAAIEHYLATSEQLASRALVRRACRQRRAPAVQRLPGTVRATCDVGASVAGRAACRRELAAPTRCAGVPQADDLRVFGARRRVHARCRSRSSARRERAARLPVATKSRRRSPSAGVE